MCRRTRSDGRATRRVDPGESAERAGRLRSESARRRPAVALRQVAPSTAVTARRLVARHRTDLLRATRRQDAHRDTHQGHDAERNVFQLVLHVVASVNTENSQLYFTPSLSVAG